MAYNLASAYSVRALQVGQYARYNVFVCGPKFITRLVVRIPPVAPKWGTNTLNFMPNFKFSRSKVFFFWGGALIPILVCTNKTWSISSAYENLRGQHRKCSLLRKIYLGGSILANKTFLFVDQSSRDFFPWNARGRNRCRSHFFSILDIWSRFRDIRDQS